MITYSNGGVKMPKTFNITYTNSTRIKFALYAQVMPAVHHLLSV